MERDDIVCMIAEDPSVYTALVAERDKYKQALELIIEFKDAYQEQGEIDSGSNLPLIYDMYAAAKRAVDNDK